MPPRTYAELAAGARSLGDAELFARAALGRRHGRWQLRGPAPRPGSGGDVGGGPGPTGAGRLVVALVARGAAVRGRQPGPTTSPAAAPSPTRPWPWLAAWVTTPRWPTPSVRTCDSRAGPADQPLRLAAADELVAAARRAGDAELELLGRRWRSSRSWRSATSPRPNGTSPRPSRWRNGSASRSCAGSRRADARDAGPPPRRPRRGAATFAELANADGRAAGSAAVEMVVEAGLAAVVLREQGEAQRAADRFRAVAMRHGEAGRGIDPVPAFVIEQLPDPDGVRRLLAAFAPGELVGADESIFLLLTGYELLCRGVRRRGGTGSGGNGAPHAVQRGCSSSTGSPASATGRWRRGWGWPRRCSARSIEPRRWFDEALSALVPLPAPRLVDDVPTTAWPGSASRRGPSTLDAIVAANELVRDGEVWQVAFAGRRATFTDAKGLRDLAVLLGRPGREVHALELMGSTAVGRGAGRRAGRSRPAGLRAARPRPDRGHRRGRGASRRCAVPSGSTTSAPRCCTSWPRRWASAGAIGRPPAIRGSGRARRSACASAAAIERIDRELPDLGRHLRHSVRTGLWCAYEPEQPIDWTL